jgi:hypothetical protein
MAASFNEPEVRVEARVLVLASEGRIMEPAAAPGRWMIARVIPLWSLADRLAFP